MKRNNIYRLLIIIFILFFTFNPDIMGQPPDPPGGHGLNGNQGPGGDAPIDGGSLILLLGGLGYGVVKVRKVGKVGKVRKWGK